MGRDVKNRPHNQQEAGGNGKHMAVAGGNEEPRQASVFSMARGDIRSRM